MVQNVDQSCPQLEMASSMHCLFLKPEDVQFVITEAKSEVKIKTSLDVVRKSQNPNTTHECISETSHKNIQRTLRLFSGVTRTQNSAN